MGNDSNNRALVTSQKVYGWLLRAYPRTHRHSYGPAMAQLFRDQCRDAWEEEQGRGMFKLWLRVLPDLVSTSIAERIAAMNERKTMTDKLADMSRFHGTTPFVTFATVFTVVFLIVFLASVTITFLLPEMYASTARIVLPDVPQPELASGIPSNGYDPHVLQTTFEIIQSQEVLNSVIEKLNLEVRWGKTYNNGQSLNSSDTSKILTQRIRLGVIRNTQYITITAYSTDKKEAAEIANAVAQSYRNYRLSLGREQKAKAHGILQAEYDYQKEQIQLVQSEVDALGAKVDTTSNTNACLSPLEQVYWDKKSDLNQMTGNIKHLPTKLPRST